VTGAVEWLLAQRLSHDSISTFPQVVADGVAHGPSQLAWCYGDLGICASLAVTATLVGDASLGETAHQLAVKTAGRERETSGVRDVGLCHGAVGVAHIYNRLYQASRDETLRAAALRWFEAAFEYRVAGGVGGVASLDVDPSGVGECETPDPTFLTGAAGVALALLAATSVEQPNWDRILLLSVANVPIGGPP
jgi:hypothetical protein